MQCQSCQHDNDDGNRFCGSCGATLTSPSDTPDASALPPSVGDGRYRTIRLLGEGSRKRVYLAHDGRLNREVAVAVVKAERLDGNGRTRITREAQAMARLGEGPHIVTVFDVGEEPDGTPFIVGQYMSGGSLDDLLAATPDRRLPVDRALAIAEQLALALAHAHNLGIVHRDIKPANVWMDMAGAARLGDFGLAADVDASRITSEGTVVGTVAYLAPEQALGREPDPRADLYALGALLYELLSGRPPFLGTDLVSVISQHLNTAPVSVRFHNEAVPERVDRLVLQLLEKDPDARPATADEVVAALRDLSSDTLATTAPTTTAPEPTVRPAAAALQADWGRFVGRADELDTLHRAVDDALGGEMKMAMVVGEPGIGKTRTVEELGVYASLRGARVLWGHCYEGEIGVPYLPFVDALRAFVRDVSDDGTLLDPAAGAAEVATIVPDLRTRYPQIPVLPALEGDAERHRLFEGIASFLEAATRIQPLVLVLDDLHWADKPTLLLLTHLARRLRRSRLLIVGTYRDVELERGHPLADTVATLRREHLYERVLLRGMTTDEVKALVEAIGGQETQDEFAHLLYRETEGNPFFVGEILRHLGETGAIRHENGRWIGTPEDVARNLPEGVREVIGRRLDGLSDDCNAMLGVAAAMTGGFTIDVVGDVTGLSEDQMLDALDEALTAQIVRERRDAEATYEFNHALIRQTLYAELSTPRRVRMHRQVTDALERRFADSIETHLPELAFHSYEAAPGGDVDKAVDYARRAGDQAMTQAAYEQAARSYGMAMQALELRSDADLSLQCDLALALARAYDCTGDIEARNASAHQAAELARLTDDVSRLASAVLARAGSYWFTAVTQDTDLLELYVEAEQALRKLPPSTERDTMLALMLTRHSSTLVFLDAEESNVRSEEAVEFARASGDDYALASALMTRLQRNDDPAVRQALLQEIAATAEASGDLGLLQQSRISLLISAMFEHRRDEVDRQTQNYSDEAQRNRVPLQLANALQDRGSVAAIAGRYGEAERLILESAALARRSGVREVLANVGVALFPVYRELGRLREFEAPTRRMVESSAITAAWSAGLAVMLAETDEAEPMEEARSIVHTILDDADDLVPDDALRRYTIGTLIEVSAAAEDVGALERLEPWVALEGADRVGAVLLGPVAYHGAWSRFVGLLDGALGRHDDAVAKHESAVACHETMRAPGWLARSRYDLAGALLARDEPDDRERAATLLNQAAETANELGMTRLLEQALAGKLALQGVPTETSLSASIDLVSASVAVERPELRAHADPEGWVTLCFSDIVGYTELTERLGDRRTHDLLRTHNELLRGELVVHKGVEVKSEGDGFMLAFRSSGYVLGFAVSFQRAIATHGWPDDIGILRVRMGIHRGEVIRDADDFFGRTVIIGARVAASADGGEVLVTDDVRQVAGETYSFGQSRHLSLKGLSGSYAASTLSW